MPRSCCALRTASHRWRSRTTLCSGDHSWARVAEAYREARTLGILGFALTFRKPNSRGQARTRRVRRADGYHGRLSSEKKQSAKTPHRKDTTQMDEIPADPLLAAQLH